GERHGGVGGGGAGHGGGVERPALPGGLEVGGLGRLPHAVRVAAGEDQGGGGQDVELEGEPLRAHVDERGPGAARDLLHGVGGRRLAQDGDGRGPGHGAPGGG